MKIAVISNCQGEGLAACLRETNPSLQAQYIPLGTVKDGTHSLESIAAENDWIFAQKLLASDIPDSMAAKVYFFPSFAFAGYHPDMTYLRGLRKDGAIEAIIGPMHMYNSALVIYGYLKGWSVEQIIDSFNADVFQKLGYFDKWQSAKSEFIEECNELGMPTADLFARWEKRGCFMYSFNHPEIKVVADVAVELLKKAGIPIVNRNAGMYVKDPLRVMPVWPVYPEIAERLGITGDYAFKRNENYDTVSLAEFVNLSVATYQQYELSSLEPLNFYLTDFDQRMSTVLTSTHEYSPAVPTQGAIAERRSLNPYSGLPDTQFWKRSVATILVEDVDPVLEPRFLITAQDRVATAGSCFAQHIARALKENGFNYYVTEVAAPEIDSTEAMERNFGVFSARYGNLYTARQLNQLLKRMAGSHVPIEQFWGRADGRIVDPFRPQIEPSGFSSLEELETSRSSHFASVREMLKKMNVFVFTLGLTEAWRSKKDGSVFPLAPGVAGGLMDFEHYEFVNFSTAETIADMNEFLEALERINPKCKVILTVSPVPLVATYENKHVLSATTYSKAALRVAAEELRASHPNVEYFPSYEIITGSYNRGAYFEDDLRTVKPSGVAHVMRCFFKHYVKGELSLHGVQAESPRNTYRLSEIVCDEEAIARM